MAAGPSTPRFLSLSPIRDRNSRPILLLHSAGLPSLSSPPSEIAALVSPTLSHLPPTGPLVLVICHGAFASTDAATSLLSVRSFRYLYENDSVVPRDIRSRLELIIPLHVSALTRAHIYMSSFGMQHGEYSKIQYADLLVDLEKLLGVDCTLLGLDNIDFDYDRRMRFWVGRQHETHPLKLPDPEKPLLDLDNISISADPATDSILPENHTSNLAQP